MLSPHQFPCCRPLFDFALTHLAGGTHRRSRCTIRSWRATVGRCRRVSHLRPGGGGRGRTGGRAGGRTGGRTGERAGGRAGGGRGGRGGPGGRGERGLAARPSPTRPAGRAGSVHCDRRQPPQHPDLRPLRPDLARRRAEGGVERTGLLARRARAASGPPTMDVRLGRPRRAGHGRRTAVRETSQAPGGRGAVVYGCANRRERKRRQTEGADRGPRPTHRGTAGLPDAGWKGASRRAWADRGHGRRTAVREAAQAGAVEELHRARPSMLI